MTKTLLTLTMLLSLAACDIPDKQIGDSDGDGGDESTTTDGDGDGDPDMGADSCEQQCGNVERECMYDACCSCVTANGEFMILDSYPPQFACRVDNAPAVDWEPPDCNWGECEDHVSPLAIDEVFEPIGVAPQEVIDVIGPQFDASLDWDEADVQLNVQGPMTEVSLTAIPTGAYRGVERIWVAPEDLPDLEGTCDSSVEVDVDVTLSTADGSLGESFAGVVATSGNATIDFNPPIVALHHQFPVDGFNGALELSVDENSTLDPAVDLNVQFGRISEAGDPEARFGSLTIGVETIFEDFASYTWAEFARWSVGGG
jgi:hypothetical protein